jgi:hypothetical protein
MLGKLRWAARPLIGKCTAVPSVVDRIPCPQLGAGPHPVKTFLDGCYEHERVGGHKLLTGSSPGLAGDEAAHEAAELTLWAEVGVPGETSEGRSRLTRINQMNLANGRMPSCYSNTQHCF